MYQTVYLFNHKPRGGGWGHGLNPELVHELYLHAKKMFIHSCHTANIFILFKKDRKMNEKPCSSTSTSWCFQWRRPGFKSPQHHCNYCIIKKPHPLSSCPCPILTPVCGSGSVLLIIRKKKKGFLALFLC